MLPTHSEASWHPRPHLGALWAFGLLEQMRSVGDPDLDLRGQGTRERPQPALATEAPEARR